MGGIVITKSFASPNIFPKKTHYSYTLAQGLKSTADQLFIVRDQVFPVAVTRVLALLFHYDGNSLLGSREVDVEGSELANFGLHFDKTIMLSYDRIAGGKTQTTPHRLR